MSYGEAITVTFLDTTLRDGAQALPAEHQFPEGSKLEVAHEIASLGIATIEAGFPATPGDAEEVAAVAQTVGRTEYTVVPRRIEDGVLVDGEPYTFVPVITGLSRATPGDIERTWQAVSAAKNPGIHTFVSTAPDHMAAKFPGKTREEVAVMASKAVLHAREICSPDTVVEFSAEAAFTTDPSFLERVVRDAVQAGANVINLPDTVGHADPWRMADFFQRAAGWLIKEGAAERVKLSAHNHNDGGMATANTLAVLHGVAMAAKAYGVSPPVVQIETTIGGNLGERAGNTSFSEVAAALLLHGPEYPMPPWIGVDITKIVPVARFVFDQIGMEIPPSTPVIGADINVHRSGIHADGVIKGAIRGAPSLYGPFDARWFGHHAAAVIEDGKYQGARGRNHLGVVQGTR